MTKLAVQRIYLITHSAGVQNYCKLPHCVELFFFPLTLCHLKMIESLSCELKPTITFWVEPMGQSEKLLFFFFSSCSTRSSTTKSKVKYCVIVYFKHNRLQQSWLHCQVAFRCHHQQPGGASGASTLQITLQTEKELTTAKKKQQQQRTCHCCWNCY